MPGRIVEIANNDRFLSVHRGFLVVNSTNENRQEVGRVPLDDIDALIANSYGISFTNNVMVALAERGTPVVLCGKNHLPVGVVWPLDGNHYQSRRIDAQISCKLTLRKRLWASIVSAKIEQQALVLKTLGKTYLPVKRLAKQVRHGDPNNVEAQAARVYWTLLFGDSFRRNRDMPGINTLLNYGYTVLRSCVARATVAAGLHPSIGLHHSNESNPMRLVDDLMEPFRPFIDKAVWELVDHGQMEVSSDSKRALLQVLYLDVQVEDGRSPLIMEIQRLATSVVHVLMGEKIDIRLPTADR